MITFPAHAALTPDGKPFAPVTPSLVMPVATVVAWVIFVKTEEIHKFGVLEAAAAVIAAVTVVVIVLEVAV